TQPLEILDLLEPLLTIPPERTDHAQVELAALVERAVRSEVVLVDARVLHRRDAVLVQHVDRILESVGAGLEVGLRRVPSHQVHRALLETPERLTVLNAADFPGRRVRRSGHDTP